MNCVPEHCSYPPPSRWQSHHSENQSNENNMKTARKPCNNSHPLHTPNYGCSNPMVVLHCTIRCWLSQRIIYKDQSLFALARKKHESACFWLASCPWQSLRSAHAAYPHPVKSVCYRNYLMTFGDTSPSPPPPRLPPVSPCFLSSLSLPPPAPLSAFLRYRLTDFPLPGREYCQTVLTCDLRTGVWDDEDYERICYPITNGTWFAALLDLKTENIENEWKRFRSHAGNAITRNKFCFKLKTLEQWVTIPKEPTDLLLTLIADMTQREVILTRDDGAVEAFRPHDDMRKESCLIIHRDSNHVFYAIKKKKHNDRVEHRLSANPDHKLRAKTARIRQLDEPGETSRSLILTTINVCSLERHIRKLTSWEADIICIQETGALERHKKSIEHVARNAGWYVIWGTMAEEISVKTKHGNTFERATKGGLAVMIRSVLKAETMKNDKENLTHSYVHQGRVQHISVFVNQRTK